jgi:hypothetical protein
MNADMPYRIYRRQGLEPHDPFWPAVERDVRSPEHVPPAEVIELLAPETSSVPVGPERYRVICEWAATMEGWRVPRRPMYARLAGSDGVGPEIDMAEGIDLT